MSELTPTYKTQTHRWFKFVLFAGMMLFAFYASTHMVAAGDTWVAMACGRHFANHGVDTVEPFSFNSHPAGPSDEALEKYPEWSRGLIKKWCPTGWINQNWLTHLIFYKLASWFGDGDNYNYNALVYWKFSIYFLAVFCVYATGKLMGAGDFLSATGACLAMVVGRTFYDIRPSGYSNLLVPVFILLLALTLYKNYHFIWLLIPLVVFWANVHGGYLYAFIMLVPFIGTHLLLRIPRRWTISLGFIGLWLIMYLISYKFISNTEYLTIQKILGKSDAVPVLFKDKILIIWAILATISVILTILKNIKPPLFYAYHIGVGAIYFLSLATRFLTEVPDRLTKTFYEIYSYFIFTSQMTFLFISIVGCLLILAMALKKERFIILPTKGIYHTMGASIIAFIAMIIFNPFHLTNLTHTFEISVSKHAESWRQVSEWKPAFDFMDKTTKIPNNVGEQEAFAVMCILTGIALLLWLTGHFLKPQLNIKDSRKKQISEIQTDSFKWPKIDMALIIISFLTMYMAIRSRRFIAIAGPAAAPAVFLMILQGWNMLTARFSWKKGNLLKPINLNPLIQNSIRFVTVLLILGLGIFWGMKYKRVYLDPWPTNDCYSSVFMRMTASHLKPFDACKFINDNQISGRVFNYWTEGGAVAFGEKPDPETGQIPLKLFMDGRAQAAYDHEKFRLWQEIYSGGPAIYEAKRRGGKIKGEDIKESGKWINAQLEKYNVWVVLIPMTEETKERRSNFITALKTTPNWKTAYLDDTQHLMVNIETTKGKGLVEKILKDEAIFPNAYSKNITRSTVIIENHDREQYNNLYPLIRGAFEERQTPPSTSAMTNLAQSPNIRTKIIEDFKAYWDKFTQNQNDYKKHDGYFLRLASAAVCSQFLRRYDPEGRDEYEKYSDEFKDEINNLKVNYMW